MDIAEYFQLDALVPEWAMVLPPIGGALVGAGLGEIGEYITRCHKSVAQYISTRPMF